jgi:GTP-binding protein
MQITSAKFMRGVAGTDELLGDGTPQVALIGRSNVGKSSIINSLTNADIARTSDTPGRTQEINIYSLNGAPQSADGIYLLDLPGYGFAQASRDTREKLQKLINWYLFDSPYRQKFVALVVDANVGPTNADLDMLQALQEHEKNIFVVANKIDKIKKSEYEEKIGTLSGLVASDKIIPYSSETGIGIKELTQAILGNF